MTIYILLVFTIFFLGGWLKKYSNGKRLFCIAVGTMLTLLMGLRSYNIGINDVANSYIPMYELISKNELSYIFSHIGHDHLFWIIARGIASLGINGQGWLFFQSTLFVSTVMTLIYRKSKSPVLSTILFLALNYYGHAFTILRQAMAISCVIIAFLYMEDNKKIRSFLFWGFAICFHVTAVVFGLYYVLRNTKINFKQWVLVIAAYIAANYFFSFVLSFIQQVFTADRFMRYFQLKTNTFNYTMLIVSLVPYVLSFINRKQALKNDPNVTVFFNLATLNIVTLCFISVWDLLFRIAMYFGIFSIVLLPNTLYYDRSKARQWLIYVGVVVAYSAYFVLFATENAGILPYEWCI